MNYEKIQKDFKRMSEDTKKLIDQYNKKVTSIKKEELAISKVKEKLTELQEQAKNPFLEQTSNSIKQAEENIIKLNEKLAETEKTLQEVNGRGILTESKDIYGNTVQYKKFTPEDENIRTNALKDKTNISTEIMQTQEKISELKRQFEELNQTDPKLSKNIEDTKTKLQLMTESLSETKTKANEFKRAIETSVSSDKTEPLRDGIGKVNDGFKTASKGAFNFGKKLSKSMSGGISKQIGDIGNKLDKFKNKMTRLIGTAMIFSLIRNSLTKLRNGLLSMLNTNDAFSTSLSQIKGNLLTAFAPIYNAILPMINTLMNALSQLTATFANFISSIFGTDIKSATSDAKKLSSALSDTAKSGDEASGSLSKIDKLDVIGSDSKSSGGGTGNTPDFSGINNTNGLLMDTLNKLKELISNGDWGGLARYISQGFVDGLNWITEKIKSINWSGIGTGISDFITNIDWSGILIGLVSVFGEAILGFQELLLAIDWGIALGNLSVGIRNAIFKAADYISQIKWSEIGKKLSDAITSIDWGGIGSSIITTLWNTVKGFVTMLLNIDWSAVGRKLSETLHSWMTTIIEILKNTDWGELGKKIVDAIWNFIANIDWYQLGTDIIIGLGEGIIALNDFVVGLFKELFNKILEFFGIHSPSTAFKDVGINIMNGLIDGIKSLLEFVVNLFKNIFDGICNVFSAIGSWFSENVIEPLKNLFKSIWDTIVNGAKSAWQGIKNVFSTVANFFKNIFSNAWEGVKKVFSVGGKIFDGIKDGIVNAFKAVVNAIIRGINKVVALPFNGINKVLDKIQNVSFLGITPFDFLSWRAPVPQIPELAKGAVIPPRQKFAAILGDQKHGTNIEAPLETIKQANREVLSEFFDKLGALTNEVREIVFKNFTIVAQFGNRNFKQVCYEAIRLTEQELGKPLFVS